MERAVSGVKVGRPVVTNGDFVAYLFSAVRDGDAALPKLRRNVSFLFRPLISDMRQRRLGKCCRRMVHRYVSFTAWS